MIKIFSTSRLILLTIVLLLLNNLTQAQSTANYTFSTNTTGSLALDKDGNPIDMSTGTTELYGPNVDIYAASIQTLSFPFVFMGVPYTQFSVSPDGGVRFGSTAISGHTYTPSANTPIISLTNIDNKTGVGTGKVHYKVQAGTGGNVLIIEWKDILINWNATGSTLSTFQLRLYQATGQIEMVYGQMWNSSTSAQNGVIWFGSSNTPNTVGQLNTITTTPTYNSSATTLTNTSFAASSAMTNLHSTSDGNRRVFTFTPPTAPADPTSLTFTDVGATGMTLNWTDNAINETGYLVYRSLDGTNYTLVGTLAANTTTYSATGLTPSTLYYWRVYAINEGQLSSALSGSQSTNAPSLSGTKTIGASGDYASLGDAIADIQLQGLAGALVLEFLSDYAGSETFPITLTNLTTTSSNTLTIRPATGVTGVSISGSNTTAILRIMNEDYVIIDGRPGGTGTARELTFSNSGNGPTILLIDDASNNTIRYCNIVGSNNTSITSGVVVFSTTVNTTGNDNNTIEYCDINALGSAVGIYSAGTTGKENDGNTIQNNRIRDFYINSTSTTSTYGIRLSTASTNFTVSGNSLYQTSPRAYSNTSAIHYGISVSNTSGYFTITNNYIGGSDVNCGGSAYTYSSGSARFWALEINVGTTTATSIQGNTIQNFNISSGFTTSGSTLFGGIVITNGATNLGTITGNLIGSTSANSITVNLTGSAAGPIITGIAITNGTPHNINNNTIAGITVNATSGTAYGNLYAISLGSSGAISVIEGNTVGSSSAPIINNSGSGAVTTQYVTAGIRVTAGSGTTGITINNNIIQYMNMPADATNTGATLYGMQLTSTGTVYTITNNTIRNLTTGSARISGTTSASLAGINHQGTTAPIIIRGNTIHSLSQTASSAAVVVYGIYCTGSTSGNHELSRNNIHSISLATTSTSATLEGVYVAGGVYRVFNNMIRLGIDASGNSVSGNFSISGIRKASTNAHTYVFNSIYVGGSVSSSSVNTFAFRRTSTNAADSIFNNIFVNNRSNTSGIARHYAISTSLATGLEDYNLFYANGTGGAVGSVDGGTTAQTTLLNYQTAFAGRNGNSAYGDPNYVNSTGDASAVDLHVQNPTPIEGQGVLASFSNITTDFDGDTRSSLTPVDIGADAGNFTLADIFPPSISYTALLNTASTSNRTLANVTITDATGVPTSGALQPRIWYRRSAPSATGWVSNGGTLSSGSGTNGVWTFTIDYSLLSLTPAVGETYQYYIVAQDEATTPNITTNPAGGVHTDVNTQTSAPSTPNSYNIVTGYSGDINVGTGETFTTLTGAGGLFAALNAGVLTGNVTALITSDITEDGTNALNQLVSEGGSFTLTIQPSTATERVISGSVANGMIRFNGADNVTIDGRYGGVGKYLRFRNTNTSNPTITFINDASGNTIRDCYIEGATTSSTNGVVFFSTGTTTGNDNNTIQDCVIRDRSDAAGVPANLIYSAGTSGTIANNDNTILSNELFNFTSTAINISATGNGNNWNISDNKIYQTATRTTQLKGINVAAGGGHTISNNSIGGSSADRSGTPLTVTTTTTTPIFEGIAFASTSGLPTTTISGNFISNINISSTSFPNFHGINITGSGNATISNNIIGGGANDWDTIMTGSDTYVIRQQSTGNVTISGNTIGNIRMTSSSADWLRGISISGTGSVNTVINNTIRNLITVASTSTSISSACAGIYLSTSGAGQTVSENTIRDLINTSTANSAPVCGIYIESVSSTPTATNVSRNRIYNLQATGTATGTNSPQIYGIYASSGSATYHNNQIHLGSGVGNEIRLRGIQDAGTGTNNYFYNSVLITGTTSTGTNNMYSFLRSSSATVNLRNNLFANYRTGGTGFHYAVANTHTTPATGWSATASNNNLFIAPVSDRIGEWGSGTGRSFDEWKTSSGGDANSYSALSDDVALTNFFTDHTTGELNIKNDNILCWLVNGKGIAISGIADDYGATGVRSTTAGDATDIGADEFTPTEVASTPPAANASAPPALNTTTTYTTFGNPNVSITWGNSGTVPSSLSVTYYSGEKPPGGGSVPKANMYWIITQTGGSGFSYNITLYYDENQLGGISENDLHPAKSTDNGTTWQAFLSQGTGQYQYQINTTNNTITIYGLTSFSMFALGDKNNPLPVELTSFTARVKDRDVTLEWSTATEVNNLGFEIERKLINEKDKSSEKWEKIDFVKGNGTNNKPTSYVFVDRKLNSGQYVYRLKLVDIDGSFKYSDEVRVEVSKPTITELKQNYPNSFNPETKIEYQLSNPSFVKIEVYNITGELITTLVNRELDAGYYIEVFNANNINGGLSSGVYIYRMIANDKVTGQRIVQTKKMLLIK